MTLAPRRSYLDSKLLHPSLDHLRHHPDRKRARDILYSFNDFSRDLSIAVLLSSILSVVQSQAHPLHDVALLFVRSLERGSLRLRSRSMWALHNIGYECRIGR